LTRVCEVVILDHPRMSSFVKASAVDEAGGDASPLGKPRSDELLPLARAAVAGDEDAASTLVVHVGRSMLAVVRRVLGRACPDVDDVTQDAVLAFLDSLATFRGECSVARFAQRIAILTALTAQRRLRLRERWTPPVAAPDDHPADDGAASPLDFAATRRRGALVRELLAELPDVIAESLGLHYVLGYTVDEIAVAAGVSPNTVWSRLRLGKSALRRKLDRDARLAERLEVRT
jgi:RNA polymerase sigma-70 factor (ECF subfamily)